MKHYRHKFLKDIKNPKDKSISIRLTTENFKFIKDNNLSPQKIFDEGLRLAKIKGDKI